MKHFKSETAVHPSRNFLINNWVTVRLLWLTHGIARAYLDGGVREVFRRTMRRLVRHRLSLPSWLKDLQPVSCDLCGADDASILVRKGPVALVRCNSCGLVYYNPQPVEHALREYYASGADGTYTNNLRKWQEELNSQMAQLRTEDLNALDPWLSSLPGLSPRFLDVGCATGFQLLSAKQKGWKPVGIEPSEPIARWLKDECGLDVVQGTFQEAATILAKESFDLILMSHVLEHMSCPRRVVQTAFSLLKPRGLIAIYVPNGDGIQARHDFRKWEWNGFPDHLYFFTPQTLTRLLTECGFTVEHIWTSIGHSNREQLFGLIQRCLCLDSLEQAERVAKVLGPMCLLSDLRVVARKPMP